MWGFNSGFSPEKIKGDPHTVRVERHEAQGVRYVQELSEHRPDRKLVERSIFCPDGALSYRTVCEWDADGRGVTTRNFDGDGTELQKTRTLCSADARWRKKW